MRPLEHYQEARRALAAAESTGTDPALPTTAALNAIGHAILTLSPRKARRVKRQARHAGNDGLPPHMTWCDDA